MQSEKDFLSNYNPSNYDRPSIAVDVLVFTTNKDTLQIALVRRNEHPYAGQWSLPGTFIGIKETADVAAQRCLKEKTGMSDVSIEQLYTFSEVDRDPRMRIITVGYIAMVPGEKLLYQEGSERGKAMLFDVIRTENGYYLKANTPEGPLKIEENELAFDHGNMIRTAIERMEGKIDYTEIGFRFLNHPDRFTLTELRYIYDAVKGVKSDIGNFRRFIKNRYIITGKVVNNRDDRKEMEHAGRPASTYCYLGIYRNQNN